MSPKFKLIECMALCQTLLKHVVKSGLDKLVVKTRLHPCVSHIGFYFALTVHWLKIVATLVLMAVLSERLLRCQSASIPSKTRIRWFYPCSGTQTMSEIGDQQPTTGREAKSADSMAATFHSLSVRFTKLKRRVRDLKNHYVSLIFPNHGLRATFGPLALMKWPATAPQYLIQCIF